jgi:hypothetical protein
MTTIDPDVYVIPSPDIESGPRKRHCGPHVSAESILLVRILILLLTFLPLLICLSMTTLLWVILRK